MENIDIREMFGYFLKKIGIIITLFVLTMLAGNVYTFCLQKPVYQSYSTVVLAGDESSKTTTSSDVTLNKNLISSYTEVVKSRRVLDAVNEEIGYGYDFGQLNSKISVSTIDNVSIIKITATDDEPERAQVIANSTAEHFIPVVAEKYKLNNASVLDYAVKNDEPSNKNYVKQEIIYIILSLVVSFGTAFLIFYFDRSIKTAEQVEQLTKLPVIGKIRKTNKNTDLVLKDDPKSNISEDIRTLRTNIQFILNNNNSVALITSSTPHEGKSFISTNLAIALAEARKKVVIVDGDMRLGRIHEIFNIPNEKGLSALLSSRKIVSYGDYITETRIRGLSIIPRGIVPPNPSELLDSSNMDHLIKHLRDKFDYVIIDGTPLNGLPDSLVMTKFADRTLLVCATNTTATDDMNNAIKSLENINSNASGVIMNFMPSKGKKYGGYYNSYYQSAEDNRRSKHGRH